MPGTPQKPKWAAATITKLVTSPEIGKKKQWKPNIFPFSLIPTRATTTKLAQKRETSKIKETMFNQWVAEKANIWRYMLALLDPILLCLKLCPGPARTETFFGRLPTAAYDCLGFARKKYRGIILSNIIPNSHISHWVLGIIYFFEVKYCQNNMLLFWGMLRGVYP